MAISKSGAFDLKKNITFLIVLNSALGWENEREKEIPNVLLVNYEISWITRGFQILNKENVTIAMFHSPILAENANSISLGIAFIFHHHFYGFWMHSMENIA